MRKFLISFFCFFSLSQSPYNAFAFIEDFGFIKLDIPYGWTVLNRQATEFTLEDSGKTARFIYKIMPVHNVLVKDFAEAIMQAYGGFNFRLVASNTYSFNYFYGNKLATTRLFVSGRTAHIQTKIGESEDFDELIDAGEFQTTPEGFFINPDVEMPAPEEE